MGEAAETVVVVKYSTRRGTFRGAEARVREGTRTAGKGGGRLQRPCGGAVIKRECAQKSLVRDEAGRGAGHLAARTSISRTDAEDHEEKGDHAPGM